LIKIGRDSSFKLYFPSNFFQDGLSHMYRLLIYKAILDRVGERGEVLFRRVPTYMQDRVCTYLTQLTSIVCLYKSSSIQGSCFFLHILILLICHVFRCTWSRSYLLLHIKHLIYI